MADKQIESASQEAVDCSEYMRLSRAATALHKKLNDFQHGNLHASISGGTLSIDGRGISMAYISLKPAQAKALARWMLMILELEEG